MEQLNSLFGLRHCGRTLPRRSWPSAYGQMGRCLSPCLQDLDPNLYRSRLDAALGLFTGQGDGGMALLRHVDEQMRGAAEAQRFERAAWLVRRRARLEELLAGLGRLRATHAQALLVLAEHPRGGSFDAFWLVGGRVADWAPLQDAGDLHARTAAALGRADTGHGVAHLPADAVGEARIVQTWLAAHPAPALGLQPRPDAAALAAFVAGAEAAGAAAAGQAARARPAGAAAAG
jgi:DNA polymerase-3 subunit epsilon